VSHEKQLMAERGWWWLRESTSAARQTIHLIQQPPRQFISAQHPKLMYSVPRLLSGRCERKHCVCNETKFLTGYRTRARAGSNWNCALYSNKTFIFPAIPVFYKIYSHVPYY
jgi:hypothetical protein